MQPQPTVEDSQGYERGGEEQENDAKQTPDAIPRKPGCLPPGAIVRLGFEISVFLPKLNKPLARFQEGAAFEADDSKGDDRQDCAYNAEDQDDTRSVLCAELVGGNHQDLRRQHDGTEPGKVLLFFPQRLMVVFAECVSCLKFL